MDRDEIIRVLRAFEAAGLEYVLIGAAAMGCHGLVRATKDLGLIIRATPENVERLRAALRDAYDGDPQTEAVTSADLLGDYPAVRYYPPTGDLYIDVLTRLGDAVRFEAVDAETKEIEGARVRVATPAALVRLKKGTVRAIDRQDAAALRERAPWKTMTDTRVEKYRSIDDMNGPPARSAPPSDFERFLRHCARYWAIAPRTYPRGVFTFRTLEDAQHARPGRTDSRS